ncbi:hypothetical protein FOZ63_016968, partial [Perkinsus olseni]
SAGASILDGVEVGAPGMPGRLETLQEPSAQTEGLKLSDLSIPLSDPLLRSTTVAPPPGVESTGTSEPVELSEDYSGMLTALLVLVASMLVVAIVQVAVFIKFMVAIQKQGRGLDLEEGCSVPKESPPRAAAAEETVAGL